MGFYNQKLSVLIFYFIIFNLWIFLVGHETIIIYIFKQTSRIRTIKTFEFFI